MNLFASSQTYVEFAESIIVFGLLGLFLLWVARAKGYFILPYGAKEKAPPIHFRNVLVIFAIYLVMTVLVAPLAVHVIRSSSSESPSAAAIGWVQLFTVLSIFLLFYLYSRTQPPEMLKRIWKDRSIPHPKPILTDFLMGVMTWFISFPIIVATHFVQWTPGTAGLITRAG